MPVPRAVNLNRLIVFVTVVEAGSLTAAARKLNIAKTVVSSHIQRLEAEIGASLLIRTTRSLNLTEAGSTFFNASRKILRDVDKAVSAAAQDANEPQGTLKITSPVDYGIAVVGPVIAALSNRFPDLQIELITVDRILDLVEEGIDLAIRLGRLADSSHRTIRIGNFTDWLVVSPEFLGETPLPKDPEDISNCKFVSLSVLPQPLTWIFESPEKARKTVHLHASLSGNTTIAVREIVLAGGGFAILPDFSVSEYVSSGRLTRILPRWHLPIGGIHAVFPDARQQSKKVRVFIEALRSHVGLARRSAGRV